mmetsp:Transcript_14507/g.35082  ORF Transcript_14507/g.35082 Transcript_14507/m.35082 type:complete len:469 (-) Transcript_14507:327-1733(-)
MQFDFNSDYPGLNATTVGQALPLEALSHDPIPFPDAQQISCARITTRVFNPAHSTVTTVQNVLVRTGARPLGEDASVSSNMSSDSSSSDESMKLEDQPIRHNATISVQNAYWLQRTIREAIYGRVLLAVVLKRRPPELSAADGAEWEVTADHCAVKEMSWQHIRREKDRLAEDPIKEVSSMQHLKLFFDEYQRASGRTVAHLGSSVMESFQAMRETNVMMPLDLLSDELNMYSIMPYCDGGELFERLDLNERFSEDEARYWMDQVLNGLETLQHAGICHRDMSLENLLVHQNGALIIDMGMCLMIPFQDEATQTVTAAFNIMRSNRSNQSHVPNKPFLSGRSRPRLLIRPQGTCGKWMYMSPEIYKNSEPFDGFAVDMWAAGVILFLMLTGFPPWERACATDERFHYMTAGYLVQMLTEWNIGLSGDAMDLLQRMLFLDPKDRLSLDQVKAHPWMANGQRTQPQGLRR